MKTPLYLTAAAALTLAGIGWYNTPQVQGQTASLVETTAASASSTTKFNGIINAVKPDKLVISGDQGAVPTSYLHNPSTMVVDEAGTTLTLDALKPGTAVTVQYQEEGRRMIAQKVTVRRALPASPPQATGANAALEKENALRVDEGVPAAGVVKSVSRDALVMQSDPTAGPATYGLGKNTKIVDENGSQVTLSHLKAGVPVVIQYADEGGRLVAEKVIVKSN